MENSGQVHPPMDSSGKPAEIFIDLTVSDSSDEDFLDLTVGDYENESVLAGSASFISGQSAKVSTTREVGTADDSGYDRNLSQGQICSPVSSTMYFTQSVNTCGRNTTATDSLPHSGIGDTVSCKEPPVSVFVKNKMDQGGGKTWNTLPQNKSTFPSGATNSQKASAFVRPPVNNFSNSPAENSGVHTGMGSAATISNNPALSEQVHGEASAFVQKFFCNMFTGMINVKTEPVDNGYTNALTFPQSNNTAVHGSYSSVDLSLVKQEPVDYYGHQPPHASKSYTEVHGSHSHVDLTLVKQEPVGNLNMYHQALRHRQLDYLKRDISGRGNTGFCGYVDLAAVKQEQINSSNAHQPAFASRSGSGMYGCHNNDMPTRQQGAGNSWYGAAPAFANTSNAAPHNFANSNMASGHSTLNANSSSFFNQQDVNHSHQTITIDCNSMVNTLPVPHTFSLYEAESSLKVDTQEMAVDKVQEAGSGLASDILSAVDAATRPGSIVWSLPCTLTPVSACYKNVSPEVLVREHQLYVSEEKEGHICNVEPSMVAALDMWERKVLREMNLVDHFKAIIAEDEKGMPIFLNQRYELVRGLAFVRLQALISEGLWTIAQTEITLQSLMKGSFGPIKYKCDYCAYCTDGNLEPHLKKRQHPSGSIILQLKKNGAGAEVTCIVLPSLIKIPAPFKKLFPVCPVCCAVFEDIMSCAAHTYRHGGITGVYQLRQVLHTKTFIVTMGTMKCVCGAVSPTIRDLINHWLMTNHVNLLGEDQEIAFFCCQTSRNCSFRSSSLEDTHNHVFTQHYGQKQGIVKGMYLGGPTSVRRLMPFFPMSSVKVNAGPSADEFHTEKQSNSDSVNGKAPPIAEAKATKEISSSQSTETRASATSVDKSCTKNTDNASHTYASVTASMGLSTPGESKGVLKYNVNTVSDACYTGALQQSTASSEINRAPSTANVQSDSVPKSSFSSSGHTEPFGTSLGRLSSPTENKRFLAETKSDSSNISERPKTTGNSTNNELSSSASGLTGGVSETRFSCNDQTASNKRRQEGAATAQEKRHCAGKDTINAEPVKTAAPSVLQEMSLQDEHCEKCRVSSTVSDDSYAKSPGIVDSSLELEEGLAFVKLSTLPGGVDTPSSHHPVKISQLTHGTQFGIMGYMCDYCHRVFQSRNVLLGHQQKDRHATGSIVLQQTANNKDDHLTPSCILAPACLKPNPSINSRLAPVCPVCYEVFEDIMDCVAHSYTHFGPVGTYQLHRVCYVKNVPVSEGAPVQCNLCRDEIRGFEALMDHWKLTHRWRLVKDSRCLIAYRCGTLNQCGFTSGDMGQVRKHVQDHKLKHGRMMKVMFLSKESLIPARSLLPFFPITSLTVYPYLLKQLACNKNTARGREQYCAAGSRKRYQQIAKTGCSYGLLKMLGQMLLNHLGPEKQKSR